MAKILRIINRFNLGGPTYNVAYLTRYLQPDHQTLLVGGEKDDTEDSSTFILDSLGIEGKIIPEMKRAIDPVNDYKAYVKIKELIREFKPDIVHTHASKAGALGRLAAIHCGVPVIVHTFHGHVFHSYFGKATTLFYKTVERYLARKSSAIVAISEKQKEELSKEHGICPPEKITVIPLGFDLDRFMTGNADKRTDFRKRWQLNDEVAIGIIGRLVPVKNHKLFLQAIAHLKKNTTTPFRAFVIGDGELREELIGHAKELGLSVAGHDDADLKKDVVFTSWIKNVDWANAGLDIVTLTSHNEGTPVSLIEAQASAKPILSSKVGGIENIVLDGETALLFDLANPSKFFDDLVELTQNDGLRTKMSQKGPDFVRNRFSYQRLVSDMNRLYNRLLSENMGK